MDLFDGRGQLLIYHFMFDPDADEGCPSCSFTMENVGHLNHLYARDTSLVSVSRAPLPKLQHYPGSAWAGRSRGTPRTAATSTTTSTSPSMPLSRSVEYNYKDQAELERDDPAWKGWSGEGLWGKSFPAPWRARLSHLLGIRARHRDSDGHLQLARPHCPRPPGELRRSPDAATTPP